MKGSCLNCKYGDLGFNEEPCADCYGSTKWEPIVDAETDDVAKCNDDYCEIEFKEETE